MISDWGGGGEDFVELRLVTSGQWSEREREREGLGILHKGN